ncbi:MAG TPA: uroporphyrinogen-III synthase [Burkholderiales bacterium]|jgi:uroporphyrinogen-III synthase|nr:uroporphyrinogen-III synthase [Burkholderiales bacterium]
MTTPASSANALYGRGIVITRPAEQADALAQLIREQGGRPILFPVIVIRNVADVTQLNALIQRLETFDVAIFISPNAASRGIRAVRARRELPDTLSIIAIGGGTARELQRQGIGSVTVPPERFDSETLLKLPQLQAASGVHVVIFRGEGGRALLGETLAARGAIVEYAECYKREKPEVDPGSLIDAWSRSEVDALVVTSSEGLRNLHALLGESGQRYLARTRVFVPHARIASTARDLGLDSIVVSEPGDAGLVRAMGRHFAHGRRR